jgi:hypothetical protein
MKSLEKHIKIFTILMLAGTMISACKEEDPWVDATVSPVLVDIVGAPFGYPIEKTPTVTYDSSAAELTFSARVLELDKSGILDKSKGIDSIPAPNVQITINYEINKTVKKDTVKFGSKTFIFSADALKAAGKLGDNLSSNANGLVTFKTSYKALGFEGNRIQRKGDLIKLTWSGTYKGTAFTRFSQASVSAK